MTKQEMRAYYDALGNKNRVIFVDTSDELTDIETNIAETIESNISVLKSNNDIFNRIDDTVSIYYIEVVHKDICVNSYKMKIIKQKNEDGQENTNFDLFDNTKICLENKSLYEIIEYIIQNMPKVPRSPYTRYIASFTNENKYRVKSFKNPAYSEDFTKDELVAQYKAYKNSDKDRILGIYFMDDKFEFHICNNGDLEEFDDILSAIKNEAMRLYASVCLHIMPNYVLTAPASNNSTKRQASDLCDGGLKRHLISTAMIVKILTELPYAKMKFNENEIDMMIIAALFHDFLKKGWDYEYDDVFEHPRLAANAMRCITGIIPDNNIKFITNCIESHMGENNIDPDGIAKPLPTPDTESKYVIRLADHFATSKNLAFIIDDTIYAYSDQNICTVKNYIPLSDNDAIMIDNAIGIDEIDSDIARELEITKSDAEIKLIWSHILENKRATKKQVKYIELAKKLLFS